MTEMEFIARHGARVARARAMELLCIRTADTFDKVVGAHPEMKHKIDGETRHKYLTSVIFKLLGKSASGGGGTESRSS